MSKWSEEWSSPIGPFLLRLEQLLVASKSEPIKSSSSLRTLMRSFHKRRREIVEMKRIGDDYGVGVIWREEGTRFVWPYFRPEGGYSIRRGQDRTAEQSSWSDDLVKCIFDICKAYIQGINLMIECAWIKSNGVKRFIHRTEDANKEQRTALEQISFAWGCSLLESSHSRVFPVNHARVPND